MLNERVRARRRIVVRTGFALIFVATTIATGTACIFDKGGEYKGGGRRGQGAEIVTGEPTDQPTAEPTDTASNAPETGGFPLPDAGAGGG